MRIKVTQKGYFFQPLLVDCVGQLLFEAGPDAPWLATFPGGLGAHGERLAHAGFDAV